MLSYFDIFDIFDIFRVGLPGGESYSPAMWFNNMGLSNKTAVNSRTSTGTVFNDEGLVVTTEPGEISIEGARRERNLLTGVATPISSDNDMSLSHTALVDVMFDGTESTLTVSAGGASYARPQRNFTDAYYQEGRAYLFSVKVRGLGSSIGKKVYLYSDATSDPQVASVTTLTGSDRILQFVRPAKLNSNGEKPLLRLGGHVDATLLVGEQVIVKNWHIQDITGRPGQVAAEYIDSETDYGYGVNGVKYYDTTNGNTVTDNIVTEAPGHKFVVDGGRKEQNDMFSQQDISKWAATAGVTTVQNADGSWRVTLPAGGTISTASDLANPSVTYDAGRELVTAVAMKLT